MQKYLLLGRLEVEISFKSSVYVMWEKMKTEEDEQQEWHFSDTSVLGNNFSQGLCFANIFIHYIPYAQFYNRKSCNFDWPVINEFAEIKENKTVVTDKGMGIIIELTQLEAK